MAAKKILITGCSGFIGRNISEAALRKGYAVVGIDRKPCSVDGVDFRQIDIRDREGVAGAARGADAVIHLAAITSNIEFEKSLEECYDINVNGFTSVIEAAVKNKCRKFLYASSSAVYLDSFSEDSLIDIKKQHNHYAKTKIINEMMAQSYQDLYGIRTIGLRFFSVYGNGENDKGNYASIISLFSKEKAEGRPITVYGDGKQARDMINVSDVAEISLMLMEKGTEALYNVGTGKSVSYNELAGLVGGVGVKHVENPLTSYQYLTRADTARLKKVIGDYKFVESRDWIAGRKE